MTDSHSVYLLSKMLVEEFLPEKFISINWDGIFYFESNYKKINNKTITELVDDKEDNKEDARRAIKIADFDDNFNGHEFINIDEKYEIKPNTYYTFFLYDSVIIIKQFNDEIFHALGNNFENIIIEKYSFPESKLNFEKKIIAGVKCFLINENFKIKLYSKNMNFNSFDVFDLVSFKLWRLEKIE